MIFHAKTMLLVFCLSGGTFATIPCDLGKLKAASGKLPPIWISGETHDDADCKEDQDYFKQAAYQGKIFLGLEGTYFHLPQGFYQSVWSALTPIKTVFGLEDELAFPLADFALGIGLVISGHLEGSPVFDKDKALIKRDIYLGTIVNSKVLKKIYKEMRKNKLEGPNLSTEEEALFLEFDKFMDTPSDAWQEVPTLPATFDLKTFQSVATRFAFSVARAAKAMHQSDKRTPSDDEIDRFMRAAVAWSSEWKRPKNEQEQNVKDRLKVLIEWRNITFTDHLIMKYCEAAQENKPLYAVVGRDHAPGMIALLKQALGTFGVEITARDPKQAAIQLKHLWGGKTELLKDVQGHYSVCPTIQVELKEKGLIPSDTMCSVLVDKLNSAYNACKRIIW